MAEAFGFSTGDFINSINLVKDIIKALNDSKGSSREYLEVIAELRGLETVLILVKTEYNTTAQISQRTTLRQAVEDCHSCIDDFLRSIQKYHGHLTTLGSNKKWKDVVRKIQWHLCKADELSSFRLRIASQVQNIEMLLVTIQASALSLSTQSAQAQERELKCQTGELSSMVDSVKAITKAFEDLKMTCTQSGSLNEQALKAIESTKQMLTRQHLQTFSTLQKIQDSLPPQVMLQKPVMFLDALDRLAPIHLEWINSHEAFLAVLKVRFKHAGLQMIEDGRFALQATKTKQDVNLNRPWDVCLYPGQAYDMSMLFRDSSSDTTTTCTACHHTCPGIPGEDITCENCHITFRRILEIQDSHVDFEDVQRQLLSGDAEFATKQSKRALSQEYDSTEQIKDFRRVRLICSTRDSYKTRDDHSSLQETVSANHDPALSQASYVTLFRKGRWTAAEDRQLRQLTPQHPPHNWDEISSQIGSRSPRQCHDHYVHTKEPTKAYLKDSDDSSSEEERPVNTCLAGIHKHVKRKRSILHASKV